MGETFLSADQLASAFPSNFRQEALQACAAFPATRALGRTIRIRVCGEPVAIPYRLYLDTTLIHTDSLSSRQREIVDCLLTRHNNGFTRQEHLIRIVSLNSSCVPPFVVQLAGEYVVEILEAIHQSLSTLDKALYTEFLRTNPAFLDLTAQRIASYWDCYHRDTKREDYVGFKILDFFRSLQS